MNTINKTIGFIGSGKMAEAIAGGLIKSGKSTPDNIIMCDIDATRLDYMAKTFHTQTSRDAANTFNRSDIVILAVKPQMMGTLLRDLFESNQVQSSKKTIVISIAAGLTLATYEAIIYGNINSNDIENLPIIRVMPNTPGLVLEGMSGICKNQYASPEDMKDAVGILEAIGRVLVVEETLMDALTAVSGSGPAYFFYFIEALSEAGVRAGLPPKDALDLSIATIRGAAMLLEQSGESPSALRQNVTSPGGTTEAALAVMDKNNIKEGIIQAVLRAAERSKELSN